MTAIRRSGGSSLFGRTPGYGALPPVAAVSANFSSSKR
jgi:hypothetical protein